MIGPDRWRRFFKPRYARIFEAVHKQGKIAILHCCGSVAEIMSDIIEIGLDILDVVQVSAVGMDIRELKQAHGQELCFSGSICVQTTLPFGSVDDVRREVKLRQELFRQGGLILGPTHQIQVGTPLENIVEMYLCAGSMA